jgi:DNA-binding response OmpR family regulator
MGHNIKLFSDSTKALRYLEKQTEQLVFDAVVLETLMPKLSGFELLKRIRSKFPKLTIVMYTGIGYNDEHMKLARELGANGYVSKALTLGSTYEAIMQVVLKNQNKNICKNPQLI